MPHEVGTPSQCLVAELRGPRGKKKRVDPEPQEKSQITEPPGDPAAAPSQAEFEPDLPPPPTDEPLERVATLRPTGPAPKPIPIVKPPSSNKPKETPSIFNRKKTSKEGKEDTSNVLEKKSEPFTEVALQQSWKQFGEERTNAGDTDKLILNRTLIKGEDHAVVIHLASQLEVSFLEKLEVDLIQHLRASLSNDHIILRREIVKDDKGDTKKLYTSKDIYDHMVKENPHLQELKDRLGLDFDY